MDPREARDLFPLTETCIFMNHAGVSPLCVRAVAAIEAVAGRLSSQPYPAGWAQEEADRVRGSLGRLFGVPASSVSFTRGTAHGISLLAQGLDWKPGDNVVGARGEYPANVYPWLALAERGVEYRPADSPGGRVRPEEVLSLVDGRTRVVALSQVQFWNGYRVDVKAIGEECRRRGVILAVDGIQSFGALDVDLGALPVDFAAAGAYKWLLGPNGLGFAYWHPDLLPRVRPVLVGPGSTARPMEYFDLELAYGEDAHRFEESSISVLGLAAFGAAVDLLLEVGMAVVEARVLSLARRLAEGLAERGYEVVGPWPREAAEASGIVSFRRPGAGPQEVMRDLNACRVSGRVHADFVRLSPHFYNTQEEVERVLSFLAPETAPA